MPSSPLFFPSTESRSVQTTIVQKLTGSLMKAKGLRFAVMETVAGYLKVAQNLKDTKIRQGVKRKRDFKEPQHEAQQFMHVLVVNFPMGSSSNHTQRNYSDSKKLEFMIMLVQLSNVLARTSLLVQVY